MLKIEFQSAPINLTTIKSLTEQLDTKWDDKLEVSKGYASYLAYITGYMEYIIILPEDLSDVTITDDGYIQIEPQEYITYKVDITRDDNTVPDYIVLNVLPHNEYTLIEYSFDNENYEKYEPETVIETNDKSPIYVRVTNTSDTDDLYVYSLVMVMG